MVVLENVKSFAFEEKLLNTDEKELFQTFSKAQGDLNMLSVADGFCLGMRIAVEVMEKEF